MLFFSLPKNGNLPVFIPNLEQIKSEHQRAALLIEFLPKYVKPVEDLVTYLDKDFKDNCSDRVKQLLGFNYEYPKLMDTSKSVNDIGIGYKGKN